jgi:hypothetical protein
MRREENMRAIIVKIGFSLLLASGFSIASAAAQSDAVKVDRGGITYITHAGDTLSSIAQRFTTKQDNWLVLSKVNNVGADTHIPVGTSIKIPADLLQDEPSEARIAALSGNITANSPEGAAMVLNPGAKITEGMQIATGNNSFLTLVLPDQSRISLPSNSRVRIAKLRMARYTKSPRTEIYLVNGRVESRVTPLEPSKGSFAVRTQLAVAGVRGTHFRVGVGERGTATEVLSGHVEVGQPGKPGALLLHPGQGDIIDAKTVGKAVDLLPSPQFADMPTRYGSAAAQFMLTPVPGAQAYHVQIATDQDAQNLIAETRGASTRLMIDGVANGSYFARISAVDKQGLEGPASTYAFNLAAAVQSQLSGPPAPYVDRSDSRQIFLKWSGAPGQKFMVQVARDAAFSWLIYSAKTDAGEARVPRPPFGTYYARVQTLNADGAGGTYSAAQAFIVTDEWVMNDGVPAGAKQAR